MSQVWAYLAVTALMFTGLLLIFIILLQRGRGGGLAGAFGGAGGQSALGTKAGDVFTKITVGLAVFWVFLACLSIYALRAGSEGRASFGDDSNPTAPSVADDPGAEGPGVGGAAAGGAAAGGAAAGGAAAGGATGNENGGGDAAGATPPGGDSPPDQAGAGSSSGTPPTTENPAAGETDGSASENDAPAGTNP